MGSFVLSILQMLKTDTNRLSDLSLAPLLGSGEVKWSESCSLMSNSLQPHGVYSLWNSPGQNTGVGSLSLLQGIFPNQGSNPGLPHCRQIHYQLNHQGSPRILEWVAYHFSSGSSRPRNRNGVSCIAGGFFTNWAIREASLPDHLTCLLRNLQVRKQQLELDMEQQTGSK